MKRYIFICIALFALIQLNAQYPVRVGTPESGGVILPYDNQFDYNWCTTIYPQDKINVQGSIIKVFLDVSSMTPDVYVAHNQKIYMALTSDVEFTDAGYPNTATMTKVFDGNIIYFTPGGPEDPDEIILTTPFAYNNTDNLLIHYENHDGTKVSTFQEAQINLTDNSSSFNLCKYNSQDGSFPTSSGTLSNKMPIIYLGFASGLDAGVSKVNDNKDFLLPGIHDLAVNFRNFCGDTITNVDIEWEFNGVPQTAIPWTGTLYTGQESSDINLLSNYDFAPGTYTIKAWTSSPNSGVDELNTNDANTKIITVANYIEIGHHTGSSSSFPYPTYTWYGWSSSLYRLDSMQAGRIYGIAYKVVSNGYFKTNQYIYLSETTESNLTATAYPDLESMDLVYEGDIDYTGTGWKKTLFDSSFLLNNNLILHYENRSGVYSSPTTSFASTQYYVPTTVYIGDNASFPETSGSSTGFTPMVRLYFSLPDDAGIASIDKPYLACNAGINPLEISVRNYGSNALSTVDIKYQVDDGVVENYNWSGNIDSNESISAVTIGNPNLVYGAHTIKVWTEYPNGLTDYNNDNDTTIISVFAGSPLNGAYVIGAEPSDFTSLKEAVDSLNSPSGISGSVIFDIKPGLYFEHNMLSDIYGAGESHTVTFQSQSGDSTDVIVISDSTDYTFGVFGADRVTFKNLTFMTDTTSAAVVEIGNRSDDVVFDGCVFLGNIGAGSLLYSAPNDSSIDKRLIVRNNLFVNGSVGVNIRPGQWGGTEFETGVVITNNYFHGQSDYGLHFEDFDSIRVSKNIFTSGKWAIYGRGQYGIISGNLMINNVQGAFRLFGSDHLIKNNMINVKGYSSYTTSVNIESWDTKLYNNTFIVQEGGNSCSNIYVYGKNCDFKNNIVINNDAGKVIELGGGVTGYSFDYNIYNTNGNNFSNNYATFADWQSGISGDAHSFTDAVNFASDTNLHTASFLVDGAGIPLSEVNEDFDDELRDALHPDIGADEFTSPCSGPLSGEYSLGASGTFTSFEAAMNVLKYCGMTGDVTFNIEDGTYTNQLYLDNQIPGQNSSTLTFRSASQDNTAVVIEYDAGADKNYVLKLKGADHIIFKDLTLRALNAENACVVEIGKGSCNNMLENCIIHGVASIDDSYKQALIYFTEDHTFRDTSNLFTGNLFLNGSYGILLNGNLNISETFNTISGNVFLDQAAYSIYADFQENLVIEENSFENKYDIDFSFYAIYNLFSDSTAIVSNSFDLQRDYNNSAICIQNNLNYNLIANNFIAVSSNTSSAIGINHAGHNTEIYYNSVNIYGSSKSSKAVDITYGTSKAIIKNNIFANHSGGPALFCSYSGTQVLDADNNNLYSSGDYFAHWLGTNISDLSQWQSSSGFGSNSVSSYPNFLTDTDLHTSNILLSNAGVPLPGLTLDIDGELRDASTPDIGADEFTEFSFGLVDDIRVCVDAEYTIQAGEGFDSYLWSTGDDISSILVDSSGIGYGSKEYSVSVTLDGSSYKDTVTVTFSSPLPFQQDYFCADPYSGAVLLTAVQGAEYYWNTGETTQSIWTSLSYASCTVTDINGCQGYQTINRNWNNCPAHFDMPDDTIICSKDSIVIDANSSAWCTADYAHYSYLWNTGDTTETITVYPDDIVSEYNEYSVEVLFTDNGKICMNSDTVKVYRNDCPANLGMPDDTIIYQGETLTLDANSSSCSADYTNYSYLWSTTETTETIFLDATVLGAGSYTYSVSVTNLTSPGNCITTDMVNVIVSGGTDIESLRKEDVSIYPNPTDGILTLDFNYAIENARIRVIDVTGQVIVSEYQESISGMKKFDLSELGSGVYILSIQNKNGIFSSKITIH